MRGSAINGGIRAHCALEELYEPLHPFHLARSDNISYRPMNV